MPSSPFSLSGSLAAAAIVLVPVFGVAKGSWWWGVCRAGTGNVAPRVSFVPALRRIDVETEWLATRGLVKFGSGTNPQGVFAAAEHAVGTPSPPTRSRRGGVSEASVCSKGLGVVVSDPIPVVSVPAEAVVILQMKTELPVGRLDTVATMKLSLMFDRPLSKVDSFRFVFRLRGYLALRMDGWMALSESFAANQREDTASTGIELRKFAERPKHTKPVMRP
jgi:hypothetical protein